MVAAQNQASGFDPENAIEPALANVLDERFESSLRKYRRAIELNGQLAYPHRRTADWYEHLALMMLNHVRPFPPDSPERTKVNELRETSLDKAERYRRGAIERYPTKAAYHYHLARLLHTRGKADEARKALDEALRLDALYRPQDHPAMLARPDLRGAERLRDELKK